MIEAVELGQSYRQQFQQSVNIETAQQAHYRSRLAWLPGAQHLPQLSQCRLIEVTDQFDHPVAFIAPHATEETISEVFHGRLAGLPQHLQQVLRYLLGPQSLFDELRQPIFHADARAQVSPENRS